MARLRLPCFHPEFGPSLPRATIAEEYTNPLHWPRELPSCKNRSLSGERVYATFGYGVPVPRRHVPFVGTAPFVVHVCNFLTPGRCNSSLIQPAPSRQNSTMRLDQPSAIAHPWEVFVLIIRMGREHPNFRVAPGGDCGSVSKLGTNREDHRSRQGGAGHNDHGDVSRRGMNEENLKALYPGHRARYARCIETRNLDGETARPVHQ